jgi:hypothetical protein
VHAIKHDGYLLIVRRDGGAVRVFTRRSHDRYPAIATAAAMLCAKSFTLDVGSGRRPKWRRCLQCPPLPAQGQRCDPVRFRSAGTGRCRSASFAAWGAQGEAGGAAGAQPGRYRAQRAHRPGRPHRDCGEAARGALLLRTVSKTGSKSRTRTAPQCGWREKPDGEPSRAGATAGTRRWPLELGITLALGLRLKNGWTAGDF